MSNTKTWLVIIASLILLFTPLFFVSIFLLIFLVKKNPESKHIQSAPYIFVGLFAFVVCSAIPNINDVAPSGKDQLIGTGIGAFIALVVISHGLRKVGSKFSN